MGSSDRVPFYLNERFASADQTTEQSLMSRWLTDALRFATAQSAGTDVVLGGLNVTPSGTSVAISQGAILQASPLASDPDVDPITGATLAFEPQSPNTFALPTPVADTWYIFECRAQDVDDPTVSRDVWDTDLSVWLPTNLVKRRRRTLEYQITGVDGVTTIPLPTAGWVPLAGIFRPGGGGAVAPLHVIDLRPLAAESAVLERGALVKCNWTTDTPGAGTTATVIDRFDVQIDSAEGPLRGNGLVDLANTALRNPDDPAPVADEWWQLYFCPWGPAGARIRPRLVNHQPGISSSEGVFVLSRVAPTAVQLTANIRPPPPFDVAIVKGVCWGAVRRNALNTGWLGANCVGGHVSMDYPVGSPFTPPVVIFGDQGGTNPVPTCAANFDAQLSRFGGPGSAGVVRFDGDSGQLYTQTLAAVDQLSVRFHHMDLQIAEGSGYDVTSSGTGQLACRFLGYTMLT